MPAQVFTFTFVLSVLTDSFSKAIRQTVRIVEMDHPQGVLRTGDRATVTFEFLSRPEHITEGALPCFKRPKIPL